GKIEARGHHPEHCVLSTFNSKRAADYPRVRSEATLPQTVTEDDDLIAACHVVFGKECTAQQRRYAKQVENAFRSLGGHDPLGIALAEREIDAQVLVSAETGEGAALAHVE